MARLPYADENSSAETKALADEIRRQRGGRTLHVYNMLLNSPPVAAAWVPLFTAVRQKCSLDGRYLELACLRIGLLNRSNYQYSAHIPFALKEGITQEQIAALECWETSGGYDATDRAVLKFADAMTRDIDVPDDVFDELRAHFNHREIVELTVTIACYNAMSRVLVALKVDSEESHVKKV